jgi:hypothetical protein
MEARAASHPPTPEATTGSFESSNYYSLDEYLQTFGNTYEIKWHLENISVGCATSQDLIDPAQLRQLYYEYKKDTTGLRLVSEHEAGHFCAGEDHGEKVEATTIPEGNSLGRTFYRSLSINPKSTRDLRKLIVFSLAGGHGANSNFGTGSDHGKANNIAQYMSAIHNEGSVSSILNNGHSEARHSSKRGSRRFMEVSRILYLKRHIKN